MLKIIITSPSLNPCYNVSGISSVVRFIISQNKDAEYTHFEIGKRETEKGGLFRVIKVVGEYVKWKRLLKEQSDPIIHYSFPLSALSILRDAPFLFYCKRHRRKIVIHIHGGQYLTSTHIPFYLHIILKKIFSWDVPFIVLSEKETKILKTRFNVKRVFPLPNCVSLDDEYCQDKEWKTNNSAPLSIGYLGRIEPNKGMTELLHACQILKSQGVKFNLNLAGKEQSDCRYLSNFKKTLNGNFVYHGVVQGDSKINFIKKIDVFVLPSYFEGLPMSLIECMSYGVVPVVTPVGSIPEVVNDRRNGLLVKVKDIESIVNAIKELNSDRSLLKTLSDSARKTIAMNFSPVDYINKLNRIYQYETEECAD